MNTEFINIQLYINNFFDSKGRINSNIVKNNGEKLRELDEFRYNKIFYFTKILDNLAPSFSQRIWHIYNNKLYIIKCKNCSNNVKFINFKLGYSLFCSKKCANKYNYTINNNIINKYGVYNISQLDFVKQKKKNTTLKNYGVENPSLSDEIKRKKKISSLKNFGVDNPLKSKLIKDKIKSTYRNKYGVDYPSQVPDIFDKQAHSYKFHNYILPSGEIIKLQGYEPRAIDMLLNIYDECDILYKKRDVPEIWYIHKNNKCRYYPDFYIPKDNLIVEVKSEWTYNLHKDRNDSKFDAVSNLGYNLKLMIL